MLEETYRLILSLRNLSEDTRFREGERVGACALFLKNPEAAMLAG